MGSIFFREGGALLGIDGKALREDGHFFKIESSSNIRFESHKVVVDSGSDGSMVAMREIPNENSHTSQFVAQLAVMLIQ